MPVARPRRLRRRAAPPSRVWMRLPTTSLQSHGRLYSPTYARLRPCTASHHLSLAIRDCGLDMMRPLTIAACFALTLAAMTAHAQEPAKAPAPTPAAATPATPAAAPAIKGNAETGRQLTYTCQGCHGVSGY